MVNTTIDLNKVVQLYPDVVKYHWKGDAYTYDPKGRIIHCVHVEGYLLPYTKRVHVWRDNFADKYVCRYKYNVHFDVSFIEQVFRYDID